MSKEDDKRLAGVATRVYDDLVHPSAVEIGKAVHRVVSVALSPVNGTLWTVEQALEWAESAATKRLDVRSVRAHDVVAPTPELLGAVVLGIQVSSASSELRDLFANLLATAVERDRARIAHPAFAEIIKQLLPDEARVALRLAELGLAGRPVQLRVELQAERQKVTFERHINTLAHEAGCQWPEMLPSYLANLARLGLIRNQEATAKWSVGAEGDQMGDIVLDRLSLEASDDREGVRRTLEELQTDRDFRLRVQVVQPGGFRVLLTNVVLTPFGEQFLSACHPTFGRQPQGMMRENAG